MLFNKLINSIATFLPNVSAGKLCVGWWFDIPAVSIYLSPLSENPRPIVGISGGGEGGGGGGGGNAKCYAKKTLLYVTLFYIFSSFSLVGNHDSTNYEHLNSNWTVKAQIYIYFVINMTREKLRNLFYIMYEK